MLTPETFSDSGFIYDETLRDPRIMAALFDLAKAESLSPQYDRTFAREVLAESEHRLLHDLGGLTPEQATDTMLAWRESKPWSDDTATAPETSQLSALEKGILHKQHYAALNQQTAHDPAAPRALYEAFGIRNFGRYSSNLLTAQYETSILEAAGKMPLASVVDVLITGVSDSTQTMAGPQQLATYTGLRQPRFYEAATIEEVQRQLEDLVDRGSAVGTLVLNTQGLPESLALANYEVPGQHTELHKHDMHGGTEAVLGPAFAQYFARDGRVIFSAPEVGAPAGLAETFTNVTGIESFSTENKPYDIFAAPFPEHYTYKPTAHARKYRPMRQALHTPPELWPADQPPELAGMLGMSVLNLQAWSTYISNIQAYRTA